MSDAQLRVARVAVPVPLPRLFDYLPPEGENLPPPGSRVLVPFGRRRLVGLVIDVGPASADVSGALKPIESLLDSALIPADLLDLLQWCVRYYVFAPGEAVNLLLPGALRRSQPFRPKVPQGFALTAAGAVADLDRSPRQAEIRKRLQSGPASRTELKQLASDAVLRRLQAQGFIEPVEEISAAPAPAAGPALNAEQRHAVAAILHARRRFAPFVLAGVTGSGKTEVYLQAARRILRSRRQVLILVPEIGLTPQLVRRFEARLGETIHVYHSALSAGERLACWQAARSGKARVVVGTRSAAFMPLVRPGLIVIDEEHDSSFKQAEGARYHGRDVAVVRAHTAGVPIVLGSATPSLESLHNVETGRYQKLVLTRRAGTARQPHWRIIDTRGSRSELGPQLVDAMRKHLRASGQVLIYRNRRGYAPVLMCTECGWQADCRRCSAHLTFHHQQASLQCHHCGAQRPKPLRCPECESPNLLPLGAGTERLEESLKAEFPDIPIHRVDRDAMRGKHDFEELLAEVRAGQPCVLVGTQMLAKGHHLPGVSLAAVLDVDQALFSADFRAPERLAQVVYQVAGRAGRGELEGEFLLLTRHPEHVLLNQLGSGDYLATARLLLKERSGAELPPARGLALLRAEAQQAEPARSFLNTAARLLSANKIRVTGPLPAIMTRRAGYWRFQLWLESESRSQLTGHISARLPELHALKSARYVRWHVDVDPLEL